MIGFQIFKICEPPRFSDTDCAKDINLVLRRIYTNQYANNLSKPPSIPSLKLLCRAPFFPPSPPHVFYGGTAHK